MPIDLCAASKWIICQANDILILKQSEEEYGNGNNFHKFSSKEFNTNEIGSLFVCFSFSFSRETHRNKRKILTERIAVMWMT